MSDFVISAGNPYPLGASIVAKNTVNLALVNDFEGPVGILLYDNKSGKQSRIELGENNRIGNIYCVQVEGIDTDRYEYTFFEGDNEYCDPYGRLICGNDRWGRTPKRLRASFVESRKMPDKKKLMTDYSDSVMYLAHVRGFTKHKSSGVKNPGTFSGIVEKIPYLKELGITTLELMPAYEFIEYEDKKKESTDVLDSFAPELPKLNYWGYKDSFFFAPKASYAEKGVKATESFAGMVNALHDAGIELIMQFYFPNEVKQAYILEVLKYWVFEYNVDGFHLMGERIPLALLGTEPMLANTKLMYYDFPVNEIYGSGKPKFRNLAVYNDDYMYTVRRFLKSDEGQICNVLKQMREVDDRFGSIHYVTNYNGFTLMDLVSYDRKHNMDNGENDRDGNPYNASWNCGFEGPTSRKAVNRLRRKQIRNAIVFNLLTQSTPLILAGDEFGNTQKGNNNPYCLDGPVTWLNWNDLIKNQDIYDFYKNCLDFRKNNKILHMGRPFKMTDYCECGCPDLSLHGEEAWKVQTDDLTRHFAMLYATIYSEADANGKLHIEKDKAKKTDYIYIAVNMHWSEHSFALPKLAPGKKWEVVINTNDEKLVGDRLSSDMKKITVKDRSIIVIMSK